MYLLDTNILSELVKKRPNENLRFRLSAIPPNRLFTSTICVMELRFGSALRNDFEDFWAKIVDHIVSRVEVLPFGDQEAVLAGDLLAFLRKKGQSIGIEDVIISATAISHKMTVVTGNVRHFSKIKGLLVENWLEPS